MIGKFLDCPCEMATATEDHILKDFVSIREKCPALKEVLVPDSVWSDFQGTALEDMDEAQHQSILLLALSRGYLRQITSPVHRYLIERGKPKKLLTKQYKNDLIERWMVKKNMVNRHQKARIFLGKLIELQCGEWIEKQGWSISNLEALGGNSDIEARSPDNIDCEIEVKYIGQKDDNFLAVVENLSGRGGARTSSPYTAADFILFKAYEAAKQLQGCAKNRIAFLVIDGMAWNFLKNPLRDRWIRWKSPGFFNKDPEFQNFLQQQKEKRYPDIEKDLAVTLGSLAKVWIVKMKDGFQYSEIYGG